MERRNLKPEDNRIHRIPISKIWVGPNNPRKAYLPWMVDELALSMDAMGQLKPVLVNRLTPERKAKVAKRLGLAECPYEYELLGGFLRKIGAEKLGWEELDALIYNLGPADALEVSYMDNVHQEMDWFGRYLAIEGLLALNVSPTDIAQRLQTSEKDVSEAKKVMGLLNDSARSKILTNCKDSGTSKEPYQITEDLMRSLSDLQDSMGEGTKTQEFLERAIQVALGRKLTASKASQLVAWIEAGNTPESFPEADGENDVDPTDTYSGYWKALPQGMVKVTKRKSDYKIHLTVPPSLAVPAVYGAFSNMESVKALAKAPEDRQFREALPTINQAASQKWVAEAEETRRSADERAKEKSQKSEVEKATRKAKKQQKALERRAAKEAKEKAKADERLKAAKAMEAKKAEALADLEAHQAGLKQSIEAYWGPGFVAGDLMDYCKEGNSTQAIHVAKSVLARSRKPKEEQQAYVAGFEKALERQTALMKRAKVLAKAPRRSRKPVLHASEPEGPPTDTPPPVPDYLDDAHKRMLQEGMELLKKGSLK